MTHIAIDNMSAHIRQLQREQAIDRERIEALEAIAEGGWRVPKSGADQESTVRAGLVAGFVDEAHGIREPEGGYREDDLYLRAVDHGRRVYQMVFGEVVRGLR